MGTFEPVSTVHRTDIPTVQTFRWGGLKLLEAGTSLQACLFRVVSVQVEGQFQGYKVEIQGSNDGEHWYALIDTQDNHMIFSEPGFANVGQYCRLLRPEVIGGDEFTDVSIWAVCRGL